MTTTNYNSVFGKMIKTVKEKWVETKYLCGIVTIKEIIKPQTLSIDLEIIADNGFDKVFINGEEFIKKIN